MREGVPICDVAESSIDAVAEKISRRRDPLGDERFPVLSSQAEDRPGGHIAE
jgi:hypothetical protein